MSTRDDTHRCDYSLGERLFIDLHDAVGTAEFRKGMAALYRESTVDDTADNMPGTKLGISHIKARFTQAAARQAMDRWYHGSVPYRTDLYDQDPVDPRLSVLNAQVNRSGLFINDNPVSSFSSSRNGSGAVLSIGYSHPNPVGTPGGNSVPIRRVLPGRTPIPGAGNHGESQRRRDRLLRDRRLRVVARPTQAGARGIRRICVRSRKQNSPGPLERDPIEEDV